eukprot:SAG11_NODE_12515_length_699_cov_1.276667_2_plen_27_part_01
MLARPCTAYATLQLYGQTRGRFVHLYL